LHSVLRLPWLAHPAAAAAQPILMAATSPLVPGGAYLGPSGPFELTGPPVPVRMPPRAMDEAVARELWRRSVELTGVSWPGES
jgi:hypothetical protein